MTARFAWTPPRAAPGDWVVYIRGNGDTLEGQVQDITTHYPEGRAEHIYRIKPYGLRNCNHVPERMIYFRGGPDTYGAIRYRPTRTRSDSRTNAAA